MSVDLEAIAQRGRCDVSTLRLAIPLLEQGYSPPFLARYRRDELGGLDESSLWALASALQTEHQIQRRRDELVEAWERTALCDPAIGSAIKKSNSLRMLNRLGRRLKHETGDGADDAMRLAVRVLNPQKGDPENLADLVAQVEGIQNATNAVAGIDAALAKRLAGDPRMIAAAVRWLAKNARILVSSIHDPHLHADDDATSDGGEDGPSQDVHPLRQSLPPKQGSASHEAASAEAASAEAASAEAASAEAEGHDDSSHDEMVPHEEMSHDEMSLAEMSHDEMSHDEMTLAEMSHDPIAESDEAVETAALTVQPSTSSDESTGSIEPFDNAAASFAPESTKELSPGLAGKKVKQKGASAKQDARKQKKVSPRQRRRRWLVGVLKPLEGKRFAGDKLSAFQIVMLGRALRSQVAQCAFEYDATKLVAELQRTAGSLNRCFEAQLRQIVLDHEADIREAAEAAWWDDLHEKASARLVTITADHLRRHVNRGGVDAKVVMAIDAIGPRTAAASIVCADGRILHNEDLPCQLSASQRSQAVARMGELIHSYHVDLIVISNGPARRASMIALGDLIAQSPDKSVRWTLADRSGADVYAGSSVADEEMRSTPRRFRAAAWLAFSVLQPAQSLAKIDPLKLRLSSFQRELADEAMSAALEDVMISGASRGGVDVNSAPVSWLMRLPGISREVAKAIDRARRESLFPSRQTVGELAEWSSVTGSRQALPFLRVFGSDEVLDGTLVHPDDYPLAKKLANALGIALPPKSPPGYLPPNFSADEDPVAKIKIAEAPVEVKPIPVEDFTTAGDRVKEFSLEETPAVETPAVEATPVEAESELAAETVEASDSGPAPSDDVSQAMESSPATSSSTAPKLELPEPVRCPLPERAKIDKCVKEWQIGSRRAHQLVQWLCDPFGDSDLSGVAPAVLTTIPASKNLKPGDTVIGVVVGVMPFGVFVELAPDCSGLVHVSRVSETYVEDLHEAVQVGDVITAWVTGIDEKRRRVGLSAISPEREAEIEAARRARDQRSYQSGPPRGGRDRGPVGPRSGGEGNQGARGAGSRAGASAGAGQSRGGQPRGGQPRGGQSRGGQGQSSQSQAAQGQATVGQAAQGGQASQGRGGASSREGSRGGGAGSRGGSGGRGGAAGRGDRGQGRQGGSRDNRGGARSGDKKPESYRVASKPEAKPITDAMQKGEEPLRSFGDLLQFFGKATSSKTADQNPPAVTEPATDSSAVETVDSRSHQSVESHQGHDVAEELRGVEVQETPSTADTPES